MRSKKRAFSLISVLIITMMTVSMLGAIVYVFSSTAGSTRASLARGDAYNAMQDGVEQAKAFLRRSMKRGLAENYDVVMPLRWSHADPGSAAWAVSHVDDLLIKRNDTDTGTDFGTVIKSDDARYNPIMIGGISYRLTVKIYDMQYDGAVIDAAMTSEERAALPQMASFVQTEVDDNDPNVLAPHEGVKESISAGLYVIRAELEPETDGVGERRMIETALMQAIDEEN